MFLGHIFFKGAQTDSLLVSSLRRNGCVRGSSDELKLNSPSVATCGIVDRPFEVRFLLLDRMCMLFGVLKTVLAMS